MSIADMETDHPSEQKYSYIRNTAAAPVRSVDYAFYIHSREQIDTVMDALDLDKKTATYFVKFMTDAQHKEISDLFVEQRLARLHQTVLADYGPAGAVKYRQMLNMLYGLSIITPTETEAYMEIFLEKARGSSLPDSSPSSQTPGASRSVPESAGNAQAGSASTAYSPAVSARSTSPVPVPEKKGKAGLIIALLVCAVVGAVLAFHTFGSSGSSGNAANEYRSSSPTSPVATKTPSSPAGMPAPSGPQAYNFEWKEVSSSLASRIGYDRENEVLAITFCDSGETYYYLEVPESEWREFRSAGSVKNYFNANIKDTYKSVMAE